MSMDSFFNVGLLRAYLGRTLSERELQAIGKVGGEVLHRIRDEPDRRRDESSADEALRYLVLAAEEVRGVADFLVSEGPWDLGEILPPDADEADLLEGYRREHGIRFARFLLRAVAHFQGAFYPSPEELAAWRASFSEELPDWEGRWPFDYIRPKAPRDRSAEEYVYLDLGADLILVADYLRLLERRLKRAAQDLPDVDASTKMLFLGNRKEAKRQYPLPLLREDVEELQIKVEAAAGVAEIIVYDDWPEFGAGLRPEED